MPTIKLNTGGDVILKGGLPSCTCCGPCTSGDITVYFEYYDNAGPTITYFDMTGDLNDGLFSGTGTGGASTLEWRDDLSPPRWVFTDSTGEMDGGVTAEGRCTPFDYYEDYIGSQYSVTVADVAF